MTHQENRWLIKAELTRLAAGPPFIMLGFKRLLADDIAVDFSGAVHISKQAYSEYFTSVPFLSNVHLSNCTLQAPLATADAFLYKMEI